MAAEGFWLDGELLGFDLETTGVDRFADVPVSFALVTMAGGRVCGRQASLVDPGRDIPAEATEVHGITTARARSEGVPLAEAVTLLTAALVDASSRGVPVVGMNLHFDLTILDVHSRRVHGEGLRGLGFDGPVLDALVLDRHFDRFRKGRRRLGDLCEEYRVVIERAHDAGADAEATLGVLAAMCRRFPALSATTPIDLHRGQVYWHRQWAASYSQWRTRQGLDPLDPTDAEWPLAGWTAAAAWEGMVAAG